MPEPLAIRLVEPLTTAEFGRYYDLRWRLLRAPWGQPRGSERDPLDDGSTHLMAVDKTGTAAGVGRLHFNSISEAQIRYMGVVPRYRRRGIGSLILEVLEERALSLGAGTVVLDARETALGFYRRHGYSVTGPGHMLFDRIAHVQMAKEIRQRGGCPVNTPA